MLYTISKPNQHQTKIKKSDFHCFLYPVSDNEQARQMISEHHQNHSSATHNCYAYLIGNDRQMRYYSDAGEPSGTAGKPMLNALLRADVTNILAIVSRYYGGIKLGVRGLIEAYGGVVSDAIATTDLVEFHVYHQIDICCDYALFNVIKRRCEHEGIALKTGVWEQQVQFVITVPEEKLQDWKTLLDNYIIPDNISYIIKDTQ